MADLEFEHHFEEIWEEVSLGLDKKYMITIESFSLLKLCPNGENSIPQSDLKNAMDLAGYKLPNHQVREMLLELKGQSKLGDADQVSKELFREVSVF